MRPYASLRRAADFSRLRRNGRRIDGEALTIYADRSRAGDPASLVGIAIGKPVGNAVVRNKIRRRLVAVLDQTLAGRPPRRLLIVAQPPAARASFAGLRDQLVAGLAQP
ncbi:MAG TPA: ribonuclease P protein component [Candidatus Baltobacteraceae bacterium]